MSTVNNRHNLPFLRTQFALISPSVESTLILALLLILAPAAMRYSKIVNDSLSSSSSSADFVKLAMAK